MRLILTAYRYLTWKRTYGSKSFLEFDFSRKREKSVANSREREIGREVVRLWLVWESNILFFVPQPT